MPALFDIEAISAKYTVEYKQSLNTVLVQEIKRFNRLLNKVKSTLSSLSQALAGQLVRLIDVRLGCILNRSRR